MANLDLEKDFQVSTPAQSEINIQTPKGPAKAANLLSPSSNSSTNSHSSPNWCLRKKIFCLFLYVTVFTNFDTGVIPAALVNIHKELGLNYTQQGLLGSLPNFGISVASFLVSYLIGKFQTKRILTLAIIFNVAFCILFALSENLYALYVSRFFMGFTQAFWIIYGPVWTNYFSPHERQTTWLGFLQGFSPLGILSFLKTSLINR
jgi:MFS family permease